MKTRYVVGLVVLVAVLLGAGARFAPSVNRDVTPTPVAHYQSASARVRITDAPQVSRGEQPYLVQLDSGTIPSGVTHLEVLSDENCQPDADGVSHCLNRVTFSTANGEGEAALRHHHRMSEEPCLTPGQTLELVG